MLHIKPAVSTQALEQTFALIGTVDVKAIPQLETLYTLPENCTVELDFVGVQRVNSMGLAQLLKLFEHWQKLNIRICIKNTNRMTGTLFKMMGLTHFLATEMTQQSTAIAVTKTSSPAEIESAQIDQAETAYREGKQYYDSKDYNKALFLFTKSAELNYANGQFYLGFMYAYGYGVEKNYEKAVTWFRKAAEQGNAQGQYSLGAMYGNGHGIEKDYIKAVEWFTKAAQQGNARGQASLATMYEYGYGVEKNLATAVHWYHKAAEHGHERAARQLAALGETI